MAAAASLACPQVNLSSSGLPPSSFSTSFRPLLWRRSKALFLNLNKQPLASNIRASSGNWDLPSRARAPFPSPPSSNYGIISPVGSVKCAYSSTRSGVGFDHGNPMVNWLKNLSLKSMKSSLLQLTPIEVCKWCLLFSVAVATSKWTLNLLFNPFFWMYFSWTWLFWPWFVAIFLAIYGVYGLRKHLEDSASVTEQLGIIVSTITWLTLVPPAHCNGFLEGWPFVFFFVYHYFFFLNVSVRKRLYGDYFPRDHDPKWDISLPNWQKLLFSVGVMAGHWLAAHEGKELHLVPGGWHNVPIWILILVTIFMQYHSTLYLAKYSEKIVVPTAVVQFGPYRFVRHPIYASTMLLFVSYFCALRAPLSCCFVTAVCLMYYGKKAKVEEDVMMESFGDGYREYTRKVKYKLIPMVY